jgi:hypothetical protein
LAKHTIKVPYRYFGDFKQWVDNWDRAGISQSTEGIYAVPIFCVAKRTGKVWFVSGVRTTNALMIKDRTSIPHHNIIREDAARASNRSLMYLKDFHYHIRLEPSGEDMNAISTLFGCRQIKVMLQGDCNAPATCMRIMNEIFKDALGKFVWVYMDDILVFSDTPEEHQQHLTRVFETLEEQGFQRTWEKCVINAQRMEILGHLIK